MGNVRLDDISFGDDDIDALFRRWREAIEAAHRWEVTGAAAFTGGLNGFALHVKPPRGVMAARTTSGGISGAPDAATLGEGEIVLQYNDGADLTDGPTAKCYTNMTADIPHPARLVVEPYGPDWMLVGANRCPEV